MGVCYIFGVVCFFYVIWLCKKLIVKSLLENYLLNVYIVRGIILNIGMLYKRNKR